MLMGLKICCLLKGGEKMRKLGKKIQNIKETVQAYAVYARGCGCYCACATSSSSSLHTSKFNSRKYSKMD